MGIPRVVSSYFRGGLASIVSAARFGSPEGVSRSSPI
jgi:hypothetical protein